jgi:hypothetical protein
MWLLLKGEVVVWLESGGAEGDLMKLNGWSSVLAALAVHPSQIGPPGSGTVSGPSF